MNQPKVSIVLVTYNRANYLRETIASIIAQTYTNWELLIIDNGSDDNTEDIIKGIAYPRIAYQKINKQKLGPAKNVALAEAIGDLIALMDDDDLWMETKLEKQVKALLAYPDAGFCYTNGYNFRNSGEIIEYPLARKEGTESDYIFQSYVKGERGIYTIGVMFWKSCLEKTGYFSDRYFFSDNTFIGNLAYYFKAVILYEPLFKRRLHTHNISSMSSVECRLEHLYNLKDYVQKGWLAAKVANATAFTVYMNTGDAMAAERNFSEAIKNYQCAWQIKPLTIIPAKKLLRLLFAYIRR